MFENIENIFENFWTKNIRIRVWLIIILENIFNSYNTWKIKKNKKLNVKNVKNIFRLIIIQNSKFKIF